MTEQNKTFIEHIEVAGDQLVSTIKRLYADGNAKRVIVRGPDGRELLAVPLNIGVIGGGLITLAAPILAALTALAAVVSKVTLEVVRELPAGQDAPDAESESAPTSASSDEASAAAGTTSDEAGPSSAGDSPSEP